jgi:hypothetical protein
LNLNVVSYRNGKERPADAGTAEGKRSGREGREVGRVMAASVYTNSHPNASVFAVEALASDNLQTAHSVI